MTAEPVLIATPALLHQSRRHRSPWFLPVLLMLPAWIPLLFSLFHASAAGRVATAFIQYDPAYYVANARQFFDHGFHLTYSNPFAPYGSPEIYFAPHLLLLGLLQNVGFSPDAAWLMFGVITTLFASFVAVEIYKQWVGWGRASHLLGLICFFWGGGALSLLGTIFGLQAGMKLTDAILSFDPAQGWWMLNFGRNLSSPTEAYYHGMFLLSVLLVSRRKFGWALAVAFVLSASHAFTGLTLALILTGFFCVEMLARNAAVSFGHVIAACGLTLAHVGYYVLFLHRFADHRALEQQWRIDWPYGFWTAFPALYLVGILALGPLTRMKKLRSTFAESNSRLCLVWFLAVMVLTQHDLVIEPRQPIHFAHGYDWMALFFLAAPALLKMFEKLLAIRQVPLRALAIAGVMFFICCDNIAWFYSFSNTGVQRHAIVLTHDEDAVLKWLSKQPASQTYVASTDRWINYLTPTYSRFRSWFGHDYNTPNALQRKLQVEATFKGGESLKDVAVYYISENDLAWTPPAGAMQVYQNPSFSVWQKSNHTR